MKPSSRPPSRLGVYFGRREGERSRAGQSGDAVAETIRLARWWGSLIIVLVFAAAFTKTDLTPVWTTLEKVSTPIAALGGAGGIAAAVAALRARGSQANTEVASVDAVRQGQRLEAQGERIIAGLLSIGVELPPDRRAEFERLLRVDPDPPR